MKKGYAPLRPDRQADLASKKKMPLRVFRRLRAATGVSPPAHEKLLKKFYQNFPKGVCANKVGMGSRSFAKSTGAAAVLRQPPKGPAEPCNREVETLASRAVSSSRLYCSQRPHAVETSQSKSRVREVCKPPSESDSFIQLWVHITDYHALSRMLFLAYLLAS